MYYYFSATVTNLQQKLESVQTTNTLLKEDLAIAKNTALDLQAENDSLKMNQGCIVDDTKKQLEVWGSSYFFKTKSNMFKLSSSLLTNILIYTV